MTQPFGIDTSVLVRLTTRDPEGDFQRRVEELRVLVEDRGCEIFLRQTRSSEKPMWRSRTTTGYRTRTPGRR